jgi:hypothetical protein
MCVRKGPYSEELRLSPAVPDEFQLCRVSWSVRPRSRQVRLRFAEQGPAVFIPSPPRRRGLAIDPQLVFSISRTWRYICDKSRAFNPIDLRYNHSATSILLARQQALAAFHCWDSHHWTITQRLPGSGIKRRRTKREPSQISKPSLLTLRFNDWRSAFSTAPWSERPPGSTSNPEI